MMKAIPHIIATYYYNYCHILVQSSVRLRERERERKEWREKSEQKERD